VSQTQLICVLTLIVVHLDKFLADRLTHARSQKSIQKEQYDNFRARLKDDALQRCDDLVNKWYLGDYSINPFVCSADCERVFQIQVLLLTIVENQINPPKRSGENSNNKNWRVLCGPHRDVIHPRVHC
jgi:hypothetical protein